MSAVQPVPPTRKPHRLLCVRKAGRGPGRGLNLVGGRTRPHASARGRCVQDAYINARGPPDLMIGRASGLLLHK